MVAVLRGPGCALGREPNFLCRDAMSSISLVAASVYVTLLALLAFLRPRAVFAEDGLSRRFGTDHEAGDSLLSLSAIAPLAALLSCAIALFASAVMGWE